MTIGHGNLGFRSGVPSWLELQERSDATRYPLIEAELGKEIPRGSNWGLYSGTTYSIRQQNVIGGILRDIVGVETSAERILTRVESLAACVATSNSFFADSFNARIPQEYWDQAGPPPGWDSWGTYFDQYPPLDLYVNLGGKNPSSELVIALLGFYYAAAAAVRHPVLGPDLLSGGDMEGGASGTVDSVGTTTRQSTTDAYRGVKAWSIGHAGTAPGHFARYQQSPPAGRLAAGERYRLSLAYKVLDTDGGGNIVPWVGVRLGPAWSSEPFDEILSDGVSTARYVAGSHALANSALYGTVTPGVWKCLLFEFILPASSLGTGVQVFYGARNVAASGTASGTVLFDDVRLQRVHRYHDYEGRLSDQSVPDVEMSQQDPIVGRRTVALASVSLINPGASDQDESLQLQYADLLLMRRPVRVISAGELDGVQLLREDCRAFTYGLISDVDAGDREITFALEDPIADLLDVELPAKKVALRDLPTSALSDQGYARLMPFGHIVSDTAFVPRRIAKSQTTGYGIYEYAYPTDSPAGVHSVHQVLSHWTRERREASPVLDAMILTAGTDYSVDTATGQIAILRDVRDYGRDRNGILIPWSLLDFDIGGSPLAAAYTFSSGTATALANHLSDIFTAAAGVTISWTYNDATHKFSVSRPGLAALNLRMSSGTNRASSQQLWANIGFETDVDRLGGGPHVGDAATFTDADQDHLINVQVYGYKDDAAGTITGTPGAAFYHGFHFIHAILRYWLKIPGAKINAGSFSSNSVLALVGQYAMPMQAPRMLLSERETVREIFTRLLRGMVADLEVDGDGVWSFRPLLDIGRIDRASLRLFTDTDILAGSFRVLQRRTDVYAGVESTYYAWARGQETSTVTWDLDVPLKYGRPEILQIRTQHFTSTQEQAGGPLVEDGQRAANVYSKQLAGPPLAVEFAVRGRMSDYTPGSRFRLTRSPAMVPGGAIKDEVFRVVRISHNMLNGMSSVTAVRDVAMPVSGGQ